jgi:hypothetical protein
MASAVEHIPSKLETLSSNPSIAKKQNKTKKQTNLVIQQKGKFSHREMHRRNTI